MRWYDKKKSFARTLKTKKSSLLSVEATKATKATTLCCGDKGKMGRHSWQPTSSSSSGEDLDCLLQGAAFHDSADSQMNVAEVFLQYSPQPECDDGIPRTCYCGATPVIATAYSRKDPGRRYYTCANVDDGDIHVWKWWDTAVLEEIIDIQREVRELKVQANESEKKVATVEVRVGGLGQNRSWVITKGIPAVVCAIALLAMVIMFKRVEDSPEEVQRIQWLLSHH